jgi:hypothetical protein
LLAIEILLRSRFKFESARIAFQFAVSIPVNRAGDTALVSRSAFVLGHQVDGMTSRFERVGQRKKTPVITERVELGIGDDAGAARGKACPEARLIAKDVKTRI